MADDVSKKAALNAGNEIGVTGLKVFSGYIHEEFQTELRGHRGTATLKRMSTSDPVVKAVLRAIGLVLRGVKWRVEPADESQAAQDEALFVESLMDDMSHTFEDFISEVMSMLVYGWSYHEIVLKTRVGPLESDPSKRSKFTDGRIGIRKIAPRSQDSLFRWEMQEDGGIAGMHQQPITGGLYFIPIEKALLFRTVSYKNSPEGESIIRAAYESWYHSTNIRNFESVGIERELAGLPVISIPSHYLSASATPDEILMRGQYEKMARDMKFNEQGGLVIPSNVYTDNEGKLTNVPLVKVELLSSGGARTIDTSSVILRHQRDIARSVLAEFVMLGGDGKGSYALSKDKTDFFLRACESIIDQISAPINRFLLPRIWDYNGLDRALLPIVKNEPIASKDLATLGAYIQALTAAGAPLFPDQSLDEYLREVADLPPPAEDAAALQQKQIDASQKAPPAPVAPKGGAAPPDPNAPAPADNGNGGTQKRDLPFGKFNQNHDHANGEFSSGGGGSSATFTTVTPQDFTAARDGGGSRPQFLTPSSPLDLQDHSLYLSNGGRVGYALDNTGDLQNVFNNGGPKGAGRQALVDAIHNGATTLDAFDGHLPALYSQFGFVPTGRMKFSDEYAPKNWNFAKDGRPDVVFMAYRGGPRASISQRSGSFATYRPGDGPYFTDYDQAKADSRSRVLAKNDDARRTSGDRSDHQHGGPRKLSKQLEAASIGFRILAQFLKFNPNHDDKNGQFSSGSGGSSGGEATALYNEAIKAEGEITPEQLISTLSPAEQAKVIDAQTRMSSA
jgi:hypothetical protein